MPTPRLDALPGRHLHVEGKTNCLKTLLSLLYEPEPTLSGLPDGSVVKNLPAKQEMWVQSLGREDPLEKGMAAHPCVLAWKSHGQSSLVGCGPWGLKESDMTLQLNSNKHH